MNAPLSQKANAQAAAAAVNLSLNDTAGALRNALSLIEQTQAASNLSCQAVDAIPDPLPPEVLDVMPLRKIGAVPANTNALAFLQSEIDSPAAGIPYIGPYGYDIDALSSLRVRQGQIVIAHPAMMLAAIPHGEEESYVVLADGITDAIWIGGQIIGERAGHKFPTYNESNRRTTHEWNHGFRARKCKRLTIRGLRVSMCGGDGLSVGGDDITLDGVVSLNNRRQGLTIGGSNRMRVVNSEFSLTGKMTIAGKVQEGAQEGPRAGIDIEPDLTDVLDLLIENCIARENQQSGILFYAGSTAAVKLLATLRGNRLEGNTNQIEIEGRVGSAIDVGIFGNYIKRRAGAGVGVRISRSSNATIGAAADGGADMNTFAGPVDRKDFRRNGRGPNTTADIQTVNGGTTTTLWNAYA